MNVPKVSMCYMSHIPFYYSPFVKQYRDTELDDTSQILLLAAQARHSEINQKSWCYFYRLFETPGKAAG